MATTYLGNVASVDTKPSDAGHIKIALGQFDLGRVFGFHDLLLDAAPDVGGGLDSLDVGEIDECLIIDLYMGVT